jgi:hypothetical protein
MKLWHFVLGALVLWLIFGQDRGSTRSPPLTGSRGYYESPYLNPSVPTGRAISTVGEVDCTVLNTSTGNGPYNLTCERDGDDIRINFPNGGFITVDSDGYHDRTGHYWDVEID